MKILIVHLGTLTQTVVATSVIKGILNKISNPEITWVTLKDENKYIFKHNKNIKNILSFNELQKRNDVFDILINLHPLFPHQKCKDLKIKEAFDYDFEDEFKEFVGFISGDQISSNMNVFQMYYKLSGLIWKGEGYNMSYYPKSRTKRHRIGLGLVNASLRSYVNDNLNIKDKKLWHIPYKKNIFKRMDEINRCSKIITDDLLTFHLSMYLRKYVYFLQTFPINIKLELFNKGEIIQVSSTVFQ